MVSNDEGEQGLASPFYSLLVEVVEEEYHHPALAMMTAFQEGKQSYQAQELALSVH
jgi:hypothetical protein